MIRTGLRTLAVAIVFAVLGFLVGRSDSGSTLAEGAATFATDVKRSTLASVAETAGLQTRALVLMENPSLMSAIKRGGAFGGEFSASIAQGMFSREGKGVEDAREMVKVEEVAPRTWLIRLPIVNVVLFETDEGLVLVDTGMAPAGPAILDAIRKVSDAPLHTIIYTHGHVDHAYGTWALIEDGASPEIIAHEALPARFERYMRLGGSIAKFMSQPLADMPRTREGFVWPTRTFSDRLELTIGGEAFVLEAHRGETDDQLFVWVPGRRALASADYYQGFLPNAGNGKRVQRYPEEWAQALRVMAALEPEILLPAHGAAIVGSDAIQGNLLTLAEALQFIVDHTIAGLDQGLRRDLVFESLVLPEHLANDPTLQIQYVSPQDISKMVLKRYTGWWDEIPSHWTPAPHATRAQEIVRLAGGLDALAARARDLIEIDIQLASHLADWAFLAEPDSRVSQDLVLEVYKQRILDERSNTMEMLAYLDAMTAARQRQLDAEGD